MKKLWVANVPRESVEALPDIMAQGVACISIREPGNEIALPKFDSCLVLEFQDYDVDRKFPSDAYLFQDWQATAIVDFVNKNKNKNFLVHCSAGISRSAAVAEALLMYLRDTHYDGGGRRHPNNYVKRILMRAFGLTPIGS